METIYKVYGTSNLLLFKEENVLDYRTGGYHPVALADTLKYGRYKIHHKLGHGGFSTVWLARDSKLEKWVSVKILTADQTKQSRELHTLRKLVECRNVVRLLDHFVHKGYNGFHQCLVFELLGPTINMIVDDYYKEGDRLETESILKMSTKVLEAVAFMHSVGYAHGDLSPRNLAFAAPRLTSLSEEDLFKVLGKPETEDLKRLDGGPLDYGVPSQLVKSAEWPGWLDADIEENQEEDDDDDDDLDDIRVIDLGEAFPQDAAPERLAQPGGLQAPEIIFTNSFDYRIDLWRAGLIIYYLTFGAMPFQWDGIDVLAASMIDFAGELPLEWQPKLAQLIFGSKCSFVVNMNETGHVAESRLERKFAERVDDPESWVLLFPVIRGLARLLPSDRVSASQALDYLIQGVERDNAKTEQNSAHAEVLSSAI